MKAVTVFGLGYVGLPAALLAASSGYNVCGYDLDLNKIRDLNSGKSYIEDISSSSIEIEIQRGKLFFTNSFSEIPETDVFLVCVPTPLTEDKLPDLQYLDSAIESIAKILKPNNLIIIESTIAPGTIKKRVLPKLLDLSSLNQENFKLAYSPERIDPGNGIWNLSNVPKLVSGLDSAALDSTYEFYSVFVNKLFKCSSVEVAEMAKLLENSFRFVNISFINEISMFCQKLHIDVNEVISAAATKPYGFMPFYPSIGVGGHCIPVDPIYLASTAREIGAEIKMINSADKVNQEIPDYFVGRAYEKINGLNGKNILVVGVAYKANVSDTRESAAEKLIASLKRRGANVFWHDELVNEWNGERSTPLSSYFDLAILVTPHDDINLEALGETPILNTRGSI